MLDGLAVELNDTILRRSRAKILVTTREPCQDVRRVWTRADIDSDPCLYVVSDLTQPVP